MTAALRVTFLAVATLLLWSCVSPEQTCRQGLPVMQARLDKVAGATEHPDVNELMFQARQQYHEALLEFRRGNFEGCKVGLEQAEILLDKAQRRRRELAG